MILNGKLVTDGGVQVAVFPSQQINITQGANSPYSHLCTKNTDNACTADKRRLYAPVDMRVVRNYYSEGYGIVIYHSVEPCLLADGTIDNFTLVCMHDNYANRWTVGTIYRQGDFFYEEGNADPSGLTTGIHVHYEVAKGHVIDRVKTCTDGRYHIINNVYLDQIFFKNFTEVRRENASGSWAGDHVFSFPEYDGEITPPTPQGSQDNFIYHAMLVNAYTNIL